MTVGEAKTQVMIAALRWYKAVEEEKNALEPMSLLHETIETYKKEVEEYLNLTLRRKK